MKHLLLTTIAAVVLVGCGKSQSPEPPTAETPDASLWEAAMFGKIEGVKRHIAAGTDLNAKDEWGTTPLRYAAIEGHKEVVELLIVKGADVNPKGKYGNTPLDLADDKETVDLLRKHGAAQVRD